jgi:hypothetical protein
MCHELRRIALGLAVLGTLAGPVRAAGSGSDRIQPADPGTLWDGISVISAVSGLDVQRAKVRVQRSGQRFSASMLNDAGEPIQTITGTVRSGRVNARRTVLHSDVGEEPMQGTWVSTKIGPYRAESIVLTNAWAAVVVTQSVMVNRSANLPPREGPSRLY